LPRLLPLLGLPTLVLPPLLPDGPHCLNHCLLQRRHPDQPLQLHLLPLLLAVRH
jgi:hypothetical protein